MCFSYQTTPYTAEKSKLFKCFLIVNWVQMGTYYLLGGKNYREEKEKTRIFQNQFFLCVTFCYKL